MISYPLRISLAGAPCSEESGGSQTPAGLAPHQEVNVADIALIGMRVRLEPLHPDHTSGLMSAAADGPFEFSRVPGSLAESFHYIKQARSLRKAGGSLAYAVVKNQDGEVIGSIRFTRMMKWEGTPSESSVEPDAVEIGESWLANTYRRPEYDIEVHFLMLRHAFEAWGVRRANFQIDTLNQQELETAESMGAVCDGVLRAHSRRLDGTVRSVASYSLLDVEWENARSGILRHLRELDQRVTAPSRESVLPLTGWTHQG
ncbi:GNAT family protein [Streptomyces sp. NPDC051014]|uniref:GNAT family N-acetyltransferase n=1 Tax=Streptomyces sp. NPDC051014 TaxID=3155751 RepID=UPI0033CF783C